MHSRDLLVVNTIQWILATSQEAFGLLLTFYTKDTISRVSNKVFIASSLFQPHIFDIGCVAHFVGICVVFFFTIV